MLDYRVLTFLALYDEMNYRKTAEKLNMTQPGVTQHIHFLEHYYGIKLFEYDGRTLSKTKNADVSIFYPYCCPFYTISPLSATVMVATIFF